LPDAVKRAQNRITNNIYTADHEINQLHQAITSKQSQLYYLPSQAQEMQVEIDVEFQKMIVNWKEEEDS
jgi:hypothetical protein